jgi:hypothetical protein
MTAVVTGYGAGSRRLADRPNVTAVTLGEAETEQVPALWTSEGFGNGASAHRCSTPA